MRTQKFSCWALLSILHLLLFALLQCNRVSAQDMPTWKTKQLSDKFYSEGATVGDFNSDGKADVASGPFWYEGPDFEVEHQFYAQDAFDPHGYSNNFFAYTEDFNHDGRDDILIYGFPGKDASWFENPGPTDRFWTRHQVLDVVDNESPTFIDINGDGKRDVVCSSGGFFGFATVPADAPEKPWRFRKISTNSAGGRFTHGMGVGDLSGDGRVDLLEKNGWWEQPESLDGDPVWKLHPFPFSKGHGNAQIFTDDVDADGDLDVVCSLNAHGYGLAWFENETSGVNGAEQVQLTEHLIMGENSTENPYGVCFSQLHAVEYVDINGDGLKDIVTGKRYWAHGPTGDADPMGPAVVYWFEHRVTSGKSVEWIPHLIDDESGVGTEVDVADVNGDGLLDVVTANKKGTYVHVQVRVQAEGPGSRLDPRSSEQRAKPASEGLPENEGLPPQEAAAAMTVPEGFQVQLAAGEPMVHQPIAMTFDEAGRLWVAEAYTYPTRAPEGQGKDKIIILEDTNSDGVFDNRKDFATGLNLVSGLQVGFGGVWVGAAPYLMFIPDRDGDDKPDSAPEILLDGFGYEDTHETLNSFTWGPDGWLYGCHGVFTHSIVGKPGTPAEERVAINAGVWKYHPLRHEFKVFAHGTSNPWGVDFNDYGEAFITACVIPHMYHLTPGGRYQRQAGRHFNPHTYDDIKTIADHAHYSGNIGDHAWWGRDDAVAHTDTDAAGGGHAHCGALIYLGNNWPSAYRNSIFMDNIHGNRINNDLLQPVGSGYVASHGHDFLFANDQWFRGISMKCAPDGSVYLCDWYDKNACHRGDAEIWDRTNGRVYRVTYGDPAQVAKANSASRNLAEFSFEQLVDLQTHSNEWQVRTSRRLLMERIDQATAEQRTMVRNRLRDSLFADAAVSKRLRALWTLESCGLLESQDLQSLLKERGHKSEYLRGWAVRFSAEHSQNADYADCVRQFPELARRETSPYVRLQFAAALQKLELDQRWELSAVLASVADDGQDANIPLVLWYGVEPLVPHDASRALELAAKSRIPLVRQFIYRRAASEPDSMEALLASLGSVSNPGTAKLILKELRAAIETRGRIDMPEGWPAIYAKLSELKDVELKSTLQWITVKFGDEAVFPALREIVGNSAVDTDSRKSALEALVAGRDPKLSSLLITLLDDTAIRGAAIRALADYSDVRATETLVGRYADFSEAEQQDAITVLVSRRETTQALLDAVDSGAIPYQDINAIAIRQIELLDDPHLIAGVNKVWGQMRTTPAEKQQRIEAWKSKLTPEVLAKADLSNGRKIYTDNCGKCHLLFGSGGDIGPDITGSNRADIDYTLHNIIDPNAQIGRDYQATRLLTESDRVIIGLVKEDNDSAIVVQTANEKLVIEKAEIADRTLSDVSMMPEGQIDTMQPDDVFDLIAYLASPTQIPLPGAGPTMSSDTNTVPGAQEAETWTSFESTGGSVSPQDMGGFPNGRWSGNRQLWWTGGTPGDQATFVFEAPSQGRYEIFVSLTKAIDYAKVSVTVNEQLAAKEMDLFSKQVVATGPISLGAFDLSEGDNRLTVEVTGANSQAIKRYMFGLDYVYLAPESSSTSAATE